VMLGRSRGEQAGTPHCSKPQSALDCYSKVTKKETGEGRLGHGVCINILRAIGSIWPFCQPQQGLRGDLQGGLRWPCHAAWAVADGWREGEHWALRSRLGLPACATSAIKG
jgi:hypothetical protein